MEVGSMRASWTSGGNEVEVITEKEGNESDADQAERHHARVLAKLLEFPIDT